MAEDPYKLLGVEKTATEAQIRAAYRKLAKKHHPDLNPGDKAAEERFKAISAANELLSDTDKRARFDRGEIDAAGQERPERQYYRDYAGSAGARGYAGAGGGQPPPGWQGGEDVDLGDILGEMFGQRRPAGPRRGADRRYSLAIGLLDAVNGARQTITLPDGGTLEVVIPAGIDDGQTLRLRGRGGPGAEGGPAGDALISVQVYPHPLFRREGGDILLELPVSLREAVLGGKVTVPTPSGAVALSVPAGAQNGRRMRLRGRGVPAHGGKPAGDLIVTLKLMLGPADPALVEFLRANPGPAFDPRVGLGGEAT